MSVTVEELRVPRERALFELITQDTAFMEVAQAQLQSAEPAALRTRLLRNAMRLTSSVVPEVFKALHHCRLLLGLGDRNIEVFCEPSPSINAFVLPPSGSGIVVGLSAAAIERLDDEELRFVLGHELGHAILGHGSLYMGVLQDLERLSPLQILRIFAWKRFAELSADRVGMLVCANADAAVRTLFKLGSGLTRPRFIAQATEALKQFEHLELDAQSAELHDTDLISTHPCNPLRIRAMELFARSQLYRRANAIPLSGADYDDDALNAETHRIMDLMQPDLSVETPEESDRGVKSFIFSAFTNIALADGKLTPEELDHLSELRITEALVHQVRDATPDPELISPANLLRAVLANRPITSLTQSKRVHLMERLVALALADGHLHQRERDALDVCAEHLAISPLVVTALLQQATRALD